MSAGRKPPADLDAQVDEAGIGELLRKVSKRVLYTDRRAGQTAAGQGTPASAEQHGPLIEFLELHCGECLSLLAATSGRVGRISANVPGSPPIVRPVNFVFDAESQSVVFRLGPGSALDRVLGSSTAVFEIDGGDWVERTGWSVIAVGDSEEVTDSAELDRLDDLELEPWAPGPRVRWMRIRATSATGRRIVRGPDVVPGHGA